MEAWDQLVAKGYKEITYDNVRKNMYLISNDGQIFSRYLNDFMKPRPDKDGYLEIGIRTENNKQRYFKIHQLVVLTYIGNPPSNMVDPTVDHKDSNILNNHYTNLRWKERAANSSERKGTLKGELNHQVKLSDDDVEKICMLLTEKKYFLREIGEMFGVSKYTISNIKRKVNWKHISEKYTFV